MLDADRDEAMRRHEERLLEIAKGRVPLFYPEKRALTEMKTDWTKGMSWDQLECLKGALNRGEAWVCERCGAINGEYLKACWNCKEKCKEPWCEVSPHH